MNLDKEIFEIAINDIMPNRFQPREMFDDKALNELATSIKEHGVIQPIIVRKVGDKYEIIAGERRYRASKLAGKATIPAIVKDMDDKEAAKVALLENLQRKDLTPIEEAKTYQTILKLDNLTQEELATNLGKSQSTIANKLRLLQLDDEVQTALLNERISERHARSLLNIEDKEMQKKLLNLIIMNRMTVKQLDEEIAKITGKPVANDDSSYKDTPIKETPIIEQTKEEIKQTTPIENEIPNVPITPNINNTESYKAPVETITENKVVEEQVTPTPIQENKQIIAEEESTEPVIPNVFDRLRIDNPENLEKVATSDIAKQVEPLINGLSKTPVTEPTPVVEQTSDLMQSVSNAINKTTDEVKETVTSTIPSFEFTKPDLVNPVSNANIEQEKVIKETPTQTVETTQNTPYGDIYDLRFAINNVRQAVQNTEKFGFKIGVEEFDLADTYQIVIKIDKNK